MNKWLLILTCWFWQDPMRSLPVFCEHWLSTEPTVWDLDDDGIVNFNDYVILIEDCNG